MVESCSTTYGERRSNRINQLVFVLVREAQDGIDPVCLDSRSEHQRAITATMGIQRVTVSLMLVLT